MTGAPARWTARFRLRCSGTNSSCMGGHVGGVRVHASEPLQRLRKAHPYDAGTPLVVQLAWQGVVRAWGVRTLPQIQSGKRCSRTLAGWEGHPSNTAASFGWVRSHTSATSCAALHAPASPLGSAMMANCSGRAATRVAAGSARTRCGGRRLVWGTVGEPSYFCGKRVGCGWYRRSDPSPPRLRPGKDALSYYNYIRHTPFECRH
jgi:hypothetical protein